MNKKILIIKIQPFLFGSVMVKGFKYFDSEENAEKYIKDNPIEDIYNEQYIGINFDKIPKL